MTQISKSKIGEPKITLTDQPDTAACQVLVRGLSQFNESRVGASNLRQLAILVAEPQTDEVVGGLWGGTAYSYLKIEILFLPESLRGQGLGRRLIHQAEAEAVRRGCTSCWLDTGSFQAPGFYERQGYQVFGRLDDYPPGHNLFFLRKTLQTSPDPDHRDN